MQVLITLQYEFILRARYFRKNTRLHARHPRQAAGRTAEGRKTTWKTLSRMTFDFERNRPLVHFGYS